MTYEERKAAIAECVEHCANVMAFMLVEHIDCRAIAEHLTDQFGVPIVVFIAGTKLVGYEVPGPWSKR